MYRCIPLKEGGNLAQNSHLKRAHARITRSFGEIASGQSFGVGASGWAPRAFVSLAQTRCGDTTH